MSHGRYNPYSGPGLWARLFALLVKLVLYYAIGIIYYKSFSPNLDWTLLHSVYFITTSITTIGYGDFVPSSRQDKLFTIIYISFGMIAVISSVADAISALVEEAERFAQYKRAHGPSTRRNSDTSTSTTSFFWRSELKWFLCIVCTIFSGAFVVWFLENFNFVDALFWSFQTATTIGYGDPIIKHKAVKAFVIVYALFSSIGLTYAMARILGVASDVSYLQKKSELLHTKLDHALIHRLDSHGRGVDRAEFVVGMLRILGHVSESDAQPWFDRFDELDVTGNGILTTEDIANFANHFQATHNTTDASPNNADYQHHKPPWAIYSSRHDTCSAWCGSWRGTFWRRFRDALFCLRTSPGRNRRASNNYQYWRRHRGSFTSPQPRALRNPLLANNETSEDNNI